MSSNEVINKIQSHIDNDKQIVVVELDNVLIQTIIQRVHMINAILSDSNASDRLKELLNSKLKKIIKCINDILGEE